MKKRQIFFYNTVHGFLVKGHTFISYYDTILDMEFIFSL